MTSAISTCEKKYQATKIKSENSREYLLYTSQKIVYKNV